MLGAGYIDFVVQFPYDVAHWARLQSESSNILKFSEWHEVTK